MYKLTCLRMAVAVIFAAELFTIGAIASPVPLQVDAVTAGLNQAIATGAIRSDGVLGDRIKQFLELVQTGRSLEDASQQTGVKVAVIRRLEQLGAKPASAKPSVKPNPSTPAVSLTESPARETHAIANAIVRGLTVANRTKEIGANSTLSGQVQNLVQVLRRGQSLQAATKFAAVPTLSRNWLINMQAIALRILPDTRP